MNHIGLAGPLRVGKDTVADYLVANHGFLKYSFSDALYREVRDAYALADQTILRSAETKELPTERLALKECDNEEFRRACANAEFGERIDLGPAEYASFLTAPRSPRWVLQRWGTEYRRAQNPDYWVDAAKVFVSTFLQSWTLAREKALRGEELTEHEETLHQTVGLVNTSVRFPNELEYARVWCNGEVWHVHRRGAMKGDHAAEQSLPVAKVDREIYNNGSLDKLYTGLSLMVTGVLRDLIVED